MQVGDDYEEFFASLQGKYKYFINIAEKNKTFYYSARG